MPIRSALVALLTASLLAAGASTASAVIVHLANGKTLSYQPLRGQGTVKPFDAFFTNLDYGGGPVMTSNTNYTLYWRPATATAYPAGFKSGVNTYFKDLEHDSSGHENVDSVATQYNNAAGEFVKYESKFAGELVDESPYPANGCTRAPICLTDEQLRAELVRYISEHKLPTDLTHEYFLLTPEGVESCFEESAEAECSANVTEKAHQAYCAYHGAISLEGGGEIVYSNDPFVNGKNCDNKNHINGPSDSALFGGMSHEHVESITDPEPNNAWTDWGAFTGEIGDKCSTFVEATEFGTPIGEVEVEGKKRKYNQVINGHKYWYQQEWSNKGHECLQRLTFEASEAPTAKFTSATVNGNEVKFDATGSTAGANVRYTWQFNDFSGHHENETQETEELTINHKFSSAGLYTVALTVLETDGASIGTAQALVVGKTQTIKFTSPAPSSATVGGATYTAAATATSGLAVAFAIDASSSSVCTILGSTVSFIGAGKCIIDANQAGNSKYAPAPEVKQEFEVAKGSQTIMFTSTAPGSATVGGPTYNVTATGGGSGNPVTFAIDATSGSVCTISGSTVSFTGVGTCTIDADQAGNPGYSAAPQAQQSFSVAAPESTATVSETSTLTGKLTPELTPNSNFALGNATVNPTTGAITFTESVGDPGTFSWLATFQNGRFGVFAARGANCKRGFVRLIGKCRPARIVFARGSKTVAAPGSVSFTLKPSASAVKALRNALKHKRGLLISVRLTFQSSLGGSPVSHTRSLAVRLKKG